jgi:signal transduction histidine kinase
MARTHIRALRKLIPLNRRQLIYGIGGIWAFLVVFLFLFSSWIAPTIARDGQQHQFAFAPALNRIVRAEPTVRTSTGLKQRLERLMGEHLPARLYLMDSKGMIVWHDSNVRKLEAPFVEHRELRQRSEGNSLRPRDGVNPGDIRKEAPVSVLRLQLDDGIFYVYMVFKPLRNVSGLQAIRSFLPLSILGAALLFAALSGFLLYVSWKFRQVHVLLAGVSHDLRGPLTSIQGNLERMLESVNGAQASPAESALKDVQALARMVNDMHQVAILESSGESIAKEPFPLAEVVMDVVMSISERAHDRRINIATDISRDLPFTLGSVSLIDRLIRNLLENAIRYTPRGGKVYVFVTQADRDVRCTISDTGHGFTPAEEKRVGRKFWRGSSSRGTDGSGLGLSIARKIAGLHGSELRLMTQPGEGTAFSFQLPAAKQANFLKATRRRP